MHTRLTDSVALILCFALTCSAACSDDVRSGGNAVNIVIDADRSDAPTPTPDVGLRLDTDAALDAAPDADASNQRCATPEQREVDTDSDGVTDCEEAEWRGGCLDPNQVDTDRDGLSDYDEFALGSNPCDADSDRDGIDDGEEVRLGLEPGSDATYGVPDDELFIAGACDESDPAPVDYRSSQAGDWKIALSPEVSSFVGVANSPGRALFENQDASVVGFIDAHASAGIERVESAFAGLDVVHSVSEGRARTHDNFDASSKIWVVATSARTDAASVRSAIVSALARGTPVILPAASAADSAQYRIRATVIDRGAGLRSLTSVSLARLPNDDESGGPPIPSLFHDPRSIARYGARTRSHCQEHTWRGGGVALEYYVVLDDSALRAPYLEHARSAVSLVARELQSQTSIGSVRIGFASTVPAQRGALRPDGPGWMLVGDDLTPVSDEFEAMAAAAACDPSADACRTSGYGLYAVSEGLRAMSQRSAPWDRRLRRNAQTSAIVISAVDDRELTTGRDPSGAMIDVDRAVFRYATDLSRYGAAALLGDGAECGEGGAAYRRVFAALRGGKSASLCDPASSQSLLPIFASFPPSALLLDRAPVSPSVHVETTFRDDPRRAQSVPREWTDGFALASSQSAVWLRGRYVDMPQTSTPCEADAHCQAPHESCRAQTCIYTMPRFLAVHYDSFESEPPTAP